MQQEKMKYVFLDQFVWINLRNSVYEKGDSELFDYLKSKVDIGECCFPLFFEHITETQSTRSQESRERLISVMLKLSNGYAIRHFSKMKDFELDAIDNNYNPKDFSNQVIKQYYGNMFGYQKKDRFDSMLQEMGVSLDADKYQRVSLVWDCLSLVGIPVFPIMNQYQENNKNAGIKTIDRYRTQKPKSIVELCQDAINMYFSVSQRDKIIELINRHTSHVPDNKRNKEIETLLQRLPTFYTNCALLYKCVNMYSLNMPTPNNDFIDMLYLSVAIPYCDIVITEDKWVSLAKQAKLDKLYNTVLSSKVDDLPLWL